MTKWPEPLSIEGKYVSVITLSLDHQSDLEEAVADGYNFKKVDQCCRFRSLKY